MTEAPDLTKAVSTLTTAVQELQKRLESVEQKTGKASDDALRASQSTYDIETQTHAAILALKMENKELFDKQRSDLEAKVVGLQTQLLNMAQASSRRGTQNQLVWAGLAVLVVVSALVARGDIKGDSLVTTVGGLLIAIGAFIVSNRTKDKSDAKTIPPPPPAER